MVFSYDGGYSSVMSAFSSSSNSSGPRVLLADDDEVLSGLLAEYLISEGCEVSCAYDGEKASEMVLGEVFDILVLDIMMPKRSGIDTLKIIRTQSAIPVIMLTARGDDLDRILGLELGADDYIAKPCNPRELLARIKAVLRRSTAPAADPHHRLSVGDITLNPGSRNAKVGTRGLSLTLTEFDILHLLLSSPNQVVSKADISLKVLGKPLSQWDRSIDMHISNLRKKLGHHVSGGERIRTLRGSGYLYTLPESGSA